MHTNNMELSYMTDFLKIAKFIVVQFVHICAYGVETIKSCFVNKFIIKSRNLAQYELHLHTKLSNIKL